MTRRDIWLLTDGRLWRVRGRLGGDGGQEVTHDFTREVSVRSMVDRMMQTSAGTWRDLTAAVGRSPTTGTPTRVCFGSGL
ncbi:hypothetical protein DLJ46_32620 [Micromonospora globispora]|uniref:Uncharacterized protein n=1 Tax=Micromonospora globispora TaxID=1450148 RepID=A0A317JR21_9ACTN|nr:hypothetical protein DLJ46_32620 [Micromonospora globispora]